MPNIIDKFKDIVIAHPNKTAIVHHLSKNRSFNITYRDLDDRSDDLASHLTSCGISEGSLCGTFMQKSIDNVVAVLAILKTGAGFYCINSRVKIPQIAYITTLSKSRLLIIDFAGLIGFSSIDDHTEIDAKILLFSSDPISPWHASILENVSRILEINTFRSVDRSSLENPISRQIVNQDIAMALFTSGSTGFPKGVLISHQDLLNRVQTECEDYNLKNEDCLLSLLPFSFDVGCNQLFTSLITGSCLVILNSWLPADIAVAINQYGISGISAVPAIWAGLLEHGTGDMATALNKLRYITISGGDLPLRHLEQLREMAYRVDIYKTYGQTETFRSTILKPHDYKRKISSVGKPVTGTDVFILNTRGQRAVPNETGEIIHKGDGMMMGYLGDSLETRKKIRKDPLTDTTSAPFVPKTIFTGDIGKIDEEGYLYILGRKDKMIKTSGYRVYPKEIVDAIMTHTSVSEAIAFAVKDEKAGNLIFCEVIPKKELTVSEAEIKSLISGKLPSYMVPSRILFVDSFPRTGSGKIRISEIEKKYNPKRETSTNA